MEALESHYFHIPYPGALGLLRECGRPGAEKTQGCGGNLRPCARQQGETSPGCITLGSGGRAGGIMPQGGEGDLANMLMQLTLHQTMGSRAVSGYWCCIKTATCLHSVKEILYLLKTLHFKVTLKGEGLQLLAFDAIKL